MKNEIKYEQALQMLKEGKAVICQLSKREDNNEIVRDVSRLNYLYNLSKEGTQLCKIYFVSQEKIEIPENATELSFDEAYKKVYSGELVYYKEDGEEEEITTIPELIELRRKSETQGQNLILYWYE